VGYVAGNGSPAALLAAAALGMFSAEATYQTSASALIARLNHGLVRRAIESRFLTTFYGVLGVSGDFTYCNAGHNAPIVVAATGVRRLEAGGMVLGLFDNATFEEETIRLAPGDFIVAFSDGVTEAMNASGVEFGDERLLASIEMNRTREPRALLDALLQNVRTFCADATQSDDVTVVLVRYNG
jgi:sigma-B regulation protein RsbU (phosphoserine phosphatase)